MDVKVGFDEGSRIGMSLSGQQQPFLHGPNNVRSTPQQRTLNLAMLILGLKLPLTARKQTLASK